jgi:hypothetical protein
MAAERSPAFSARPGDDLAIARQRIPTESMLGLELPAEPS